MNESGMYKIWCQSNTDVLEFQHTYSFFQKKKKKKKKKTPLRKKG
jgi:hypothetical protein